MEITVAEQTWLFLASIALGAALGVCYDLFRILRVALPHPAGAVLAEDLLFFSVCGAATFCFLLAADGGQLRAFILIGECVGGVLYYCTVGALVMGVSKRIVAAVKWALDGIWRRLFRPVIRLIQKMKGILVKKMENSAIRVKKRAEISDRPLKRNRGILYNLKKRLHGNKTERDMKGRGADIHEKR